METLFVEKEADFPITKKTSQQIFLRLVCDFGWEIEEVKAGTVVKISRIDTKSTFGNFEKFELFYDLGWNNFELITPAWTCASYQATGLREMQRALEEVERSASIYAAAPLKMANDFDVATNTLMMPDKRDEIWLNLDGPVLSVLGHVASVHLNIDLVSIEEGFEYIRKLNSYYTAKNWPTNLVQSVWKRYISESCAGYEAGRYGPPPESFDEYLAMIGNYKVFMNRNGSDLERVKCARPYKDMESVDLDLFLRSIWWWSRLRVRNGNLVLEIRAIPRGEDITIRQNTLEILAELGIL